MTPLVAPPEIRGPLRSHAAKAAKDQRRDWINDQLDHGRTLRQIALALRISTSSVQRHAKPYQAKCFDRPGPPHAMPWGCACRWADFMPDQRQALYALALKWECDTPGEVMTEIVRDWLSEHQAQETHKP